MRAFYTGDRVALRPRKGGNLMDVCTELVKSYGLGWVFEVMSAEQGGGTWQHLQVRPLQKDEIHWALSDWFSLVQCVEVLADKTECVVGFARPGDAKIIHRFICELAEYGDEPNAVEVTPEILASQLASETPPFECLIAAKDGKPVGFALFVQSYSTWTGKLGLWLEDFHVSQEYHEQGIEKALFKALAQIAVSREYGCMEWAVRGWGEETVSFYESLGAAAIGGWSTWRLAGENLRRLASR